jgi:hypothetical protein
LVNPVATWADGSGQAVSGGGDHALFLSLLGAPKRRSIRATSTRSNPQATELWHSPDITVGAFGAGTYTIRNVVTGSVLAAGAVTITP